MLGRIFIDVYNEIEASVGINNTSCASWRDSLYTKVSIQVDEL